MGRAHIKTKLAQLKSPRPKQRKRTHWSLFIKTSPFLVNIKRRKSNTATSSSAKPSAYKYLLSSALTAPPSLSLFRLLALRVCVCLFLSLNSLFGTIREFEQACWFTRTSSQVLSLPTIFYFYFSDDLDLCFVYEAILFKLCFLIMCYRF